VTSVGTPLVWIVFGLIIVAMLALDMGVFHRRAHAVSTKEAAIWTAVWIALALLFNGYVAWRFGGAAGQAFLTGYIIEKALSVDNLFVFYVIFSSFNVAEAYQHRLLFWGIGGALVLRTGMVFGGTWLLSHFTVLAYVFGAVLIATGGKMLLRPEKQPHPERGRAFRILSRVIPTTARPAEGHLFVHEDGRLKATSLFLVLVLIELSDIVFAVDSILAIFAVTSDPFIVLTSNVFAIMGMRSLYFLLAGVARRFVYLQPGLALVIIFVGVKMAISHFVHIPVALSLAVVVFLLGTSIVASLLRTRAGKRKADARSSPARSGPPAPRAT
jgi:tellurite resistance protein TerC